jgi:hypothetical protein
MHLFENDFALLHYEIKSWLVFPYFTQNIESCIIFRQKKSYYIVTLKSHNEGTIYNFCFDRIFS